MTASTNNPVACACGEMQAHRTIEMMVRRLMAEQGKSKGSQIQSCYGVVFHQQLAKLDAMRAIERAREPA